MNSCPDCMTNEEAVGEGRRCNFHEIEYLRIVLVAEKERLNKSVEEHKHCKTLGDKNTCYCGCIAHQEQNHAKAAEERAQRMEKERDKQRMSSDILAAQVASLTEKLKLTEKVIEAARFIGTEHSALCATVACNCVGHARRRVDLAAAISKLSDSVIVE